MSKRASGIEICFFFFFSIYFCVGVNVSSESRLDLAIVMQNEIKYL